MEGRVVNRDGGGNGRTVEEVDGWILYVDTIRYAILTCARKPTLASLIYRTETTTKKCKTEKLKKLKLTGLCSAATSLGNHAVSPEEQRRNSFIRGPLVRFCRGRAYLYIFIKSHMLIN